MLSIERSKAHEGQCTLNILPCGIAHSGPVSADRRYWNPTAAEKDGVSTAYFRGRKLVAKPLGVPEGYRGVVAVKKEHNAAEDARTGLSSTSNQRVRLDGDADGEPNEEEDDEEVDVGMLEETAEFETLMVWGHDNPVDEGEDVYFRGVREMILLSEKMHSYDPSEPPTETESSEKS